MGAGRREAGGTGPAIRSDAWAGKPRRGFPWPFAGAGREQGDKPRSPLANSHLALRAARARGNHGAQIRRGGGGRDHARDTYPSNRRPRRHASGGGRLAAAPARRSAGSPPRDRRQLPRRLLPHWILSAAAVPVHAGQRGRGRSRRGRQGGQGLPVPATGSPTSRPSAPTPRSATSGSSTSSSCRNRSLTRPPRR